MTIFEFDPDNIISPALGAGIAAIAYLIHRRGKKQTAYKREMEIAKGKPVTLPERPLPWSRGFISAVFLAAFYLLAFRGLSLIPPFHNVQNGGPILMSFAFLFLGPFIAGVITVAQATSKEPWSVGSWIIAPWIPVFTNILLAISVRWEGLICVIFILPPAMISSSLGGIAAGSLQRYWHNRAARGSLYCLAALPIILAIVETRLQQPLQTRIVDTSIVIHAPANVIWQNIERVRAIAPSELRHSWANTIGFPRPVEATLSHEGIGGVRKASFERGLSFTETVTDWMPNQRIGFTIQADTSAIPSTTLDEHVTVGGRFFDVLTGEYDLQPLANGDTLLHLSSRERLSTDFNAYAAVWSDAVMRDMQSNILHVIRNRCEATTAQ